MFFESPSKSILAVNKALNNCRVAVLGKLSGLTRREIMSIVRDHGGVPHDKISPEVELIILGGDREQQETLLRNIGSEVQAGISAGTIELMSEADFWQRIGLLENHAHIRQLYTPAMMADLLKIPIRHIRRWHQRGLLRAVRIIHRLAYFDYQEVQAAKQLNDWQRRGVSLATIVKRLDELSQRMTSVQRPLTDLNFVVEGDDLLLRKDDRLVETRGQFRFDFDAFEPDAMPTCEESSTILRPSAFQLDGAVDEFAMTSEQMKARAETLEDMGRLDEAIDWYRILLNQFGPDGWVNFQLAELLYRVGDIAAARERYYVAVEVEPELIEARINLGCVLAEMAQPELAIGAFQGALARFEEYADAHYHLARLLDDLDREDEAVVHWRRFLEIAPEGPWAEEAKMRLHLQVTTREGSQQAR